MITSEIFSLKFVVKNIISKELPEFVKLLVKANRSPGE